MYICKYCLNFDSYKDMKSQSDLHLSLLDKILEGFVALFREIWQYVSPLSLIGYIV